MKQPSIQTPIAQARLRLLLVAAAAGLLWGAVAAAGALLLCVWLDLVWELPARVRIAGLFAAASGAAGVLAAFLAQAWRQSRDQRMARRLDQAGATGGLIVSGWELSGAKLAGAQLGSAMLGGERRVPETAAAVAAPTMTTQLAELAVAHAARIAAGISLGRVVPLVPLQRAAIAAGALALVVACAAWLMPALALTEWQRFTHPLADVPPYSAVRFQVEPGDTEVLYGQGLDIHTTAVGPVVDRVELVAVAAGDQEPVVLPMFEQSAGQWRATLVRITAPTQYFVRSGRARSPQFTIGVVTVPRIESVRFRVTPPAYTRDAPYEGPLPTEGLAGLSGATVEVFARSNRPLAGGTIVVSSSDDAAAEVALAPVAAGADEVRGVFPIRASGRFELRVIDEAGQASQDSLSGSITLLDDQRPLVRLMAPQPMSLATPSANLPVSVAAEDDYGVARVQLYRSLNDSRPLALDMPLATPPPRRVHEQQYLPLGAYGLSPGDEIKLFARVEDNDPAGAKGSESQVVTVRIVSQEEFEQMLRAREGLQVLMSKYQQAERRMAALAEEMDKLLAQLAELPPDSPLAKETQEQIQNLADELQKQAEAVDRAQKHVLPYDLDRNLTEQLAELARELREAAAGIAQAGQKSKSNQEAAEALRREAARLAARRKQFQQEATLPLEHLAQIFPLIEDQSRFVILVQKQRDLAERLAAFKDKSQVDDPALKARMRDLEDEQHRLREELGELLDDIDNHVNQLPDDERLDKLRKSAAGFAAAVRGSGASEAMLDGESALAEFAGGKAAVDASRAADILEGFLSQCEGMGQECVSCLAFNPSLTSGLGNSIEQILAEMGLGGGSGGSGAGLAGNGFSSRRGGMNVGLYGGLPSHASGQGGDGFGPARDQAGGPGQYSGSETIGEVALIDSPTAGGTLGGTQGSIPPQYRRRVGAYFQRIAEEASR